MTWDLDHIDSALAIGASAGAIAGVVIVVVSFLRERWKSTLGLRKAQSDLLDKMACGSSVAYVESIFGVAQFSGVQTDRATRTYRLPGGWLIVDIRDDAVYSFGITITNSKYYYNTKHLTFGCLDVNLGKSNFPESRDYCEGESYWFAAGTRHGYERYYNFRESGAMQHYWLAYNQAGAGVLPRTTKESCVDTGICIHPWAGPTNPEPIDTSGATVNTLSIVTPDVVHADLHTSYIAVDEAQTRLAPTEKRRGNTLPESPPHNHP